MKMIKTEVELQPFRVPNYVMQKGSVRPRQEGYVESPKFHLSELDKDTLTALCDQFRDAVFEKAAAGAPQSR